jgi:hypothetical protein
MSCIGDNLYIYAEKEHLLIKYDTVNSGIASQYNIPGSLPKGYTPIVVANCKLVYYPLDDIIYIYDFETSTTDTIRIRTIE